MAFVLSLVLLEGSAIRVFFHSMLGECQFDGLDTVGLGFGVKCLEMTLHYVTTPNSIENV